MKSYQIYANSLNGTGSSNHTQTYQFDWSIIPEGEYEMTFTFMSVLEKLTTANAQLTTSPSMLAIDVPFSTDKYQVNSSGYAGSTHLMGMLEIADQYSTATHTMRLVKAGYSDNSPVHIRGRPQGNNFVVKILSHGQVGAATPGYDLCITLKKC